MNCIRCGKELPDDARYCLYCGKRQNGTAPRKALKRANGTGTVYKLQGRRSRPWVAAKGKVIIGYYAKKTEALEALERLTGKDLTERYNMTFAEVFEDWKAEHYKEIGVKGQESYERAYDVFETLHNKKFRDLRMPDFPGRAGRAHEQISVHRLQVQAAHHPDVPVGHPGGDLYHHLPAFARVRSAKKRKKRSLQRRRSGSWRRTALRPPGSS